MTTTLSEPPKGPTKAEGYLLDGLTFNQFVLLVQMGRINVKAIGTRKFRYTALVAGHRTVVKGFPTEMSALLAALRAVQEGLGTVNRRVLANTD